MAIKILAVIIATSILLAVPASCSEKRPFTFQITLMAEIVDTNAQKAGFDTYHFGSTSFRGSNNATLTLMYGEFKNTEEAKRFGVDSKEGFQGACEGNKEGRRWKSD